MLSKDGIIISVLILGILFTSTGLYLVVEGKEVFSRGKGEVLAETAKNEDFIQEVEVVEEEEIYPSIDVCYEENCYVISSEIVESFYSEDSLEKTKMYMYILEYVIPYFEKISGGRTLVKNSKGSFYAWKEDYIVNTENIYEDVLKLLENRDRYDFSIKYNLHKEDLPGTDGKYADSYIEIDNSKQRLYAWRDGQVIKEIDLSAAKKGFEVYGVFPIVDKGIVPQAPSGRYMPYWMAFYYSPRQESWYGLHGLVWWYDDNGNKVFENTDYIGVRRSAGCIRMLLDDAKFLYERYEKGDHILIHE